MHGRPYHLPVRKRAAAESSVASYRIAMRPTFSFDADFQIENYLRYQGSSFVDRLTPIPTSM